MYMGPWAAIDFWSYLYPPPHQSEAEMPVTLPQSPLHSPPLLLPLRRSSSFTAALATMSSSPHPSEPSQSFSPPSLEVIGARSSFLSGFKSLQRPYKPFPIIGWNCHVETIFASFFRTVPDVTLRRECLRTSDDGALALDWVSGDERYLPFEAPVLILLPGLTGGSGDSYVRHTLVKARSKGWRVVVFNSRSCADSPVTTPKFYSASNTDDLHQVVYHIAKRYAESKLYAVGWSLGANILVRYLGQESHSCLLSGAVSLCNPFDLVVADEEFHKGFNNIYDKALARALRKGLKKHALLFEGIGGNYNIPIAANARSVREFDDGLTRVSFGFKTVDDYYFNASSSHSIKTVCRPLLCIQAANDPIAPSRGIPREEIKANPRCLLIVTPQGGHLGWVAGDEAPLGAPWSDAVILDFLEHLQKDEAEVCCGSMLNGVPQSPSSITVDIK